MGNDEILKKTEEGMREGNKVLIQELIHDLEQKGVSPVIAIDGEVHNLKIKIIDKSEIEDFEQVLRKFKFEKSDFCLLEEDTTKSHNNGLFPITGNVVVIHKKSAKLKIYKAGNGSSWVFEFDHDCANKFFI